MVAAVQTAGGVEPRIIGKPSTYSLEKVMALAGSSPDETVIIGDRLDTDVCVGKKAGSHTVLVLTGVTSEEEARNAPDEMKPDRIIHTLSELLRSPLPESGVSESRPVGRGAGVRAEQ